MSTVDACSVLQFVGITWQIWRSEVGQVIQDYQEETCVCQWWQRTVNGQHWNDWPRLNPQAGQFYYSLEQAMHWRPKILEPCTFMGVLILCQFQHGILNFKHKPQKTQSHQRFSFPATLFLTPELDAWHHNLGNVPLCTVNKKMCHFRTSRGCCKR